MEQACRRFEQYLKRRFGQSSTPKHYMSDLNIFMRTIGNKAPETVTAAEIDTFVDRQLATGLSPSTINRRLSCVRTLFEYLAGECPERVWPNPVVGRRHRLRTGSRLPRDASEDDVARLFAAIADERDRAMFGLMVGAGLRVGEVAALRLDSVEAPAAPGQLARLRVRGKGNRERIAWLTSSLWDTLQVWLKMRPSAGSEHVFLNQFGQPISVSGIQYCLGQHCQAGGMTLTCHQLRHTFSRRLVEHGLPVDSLAKLLGHSHLQTTQRYINGADPTVRADFDAAMAHLEDAFTKTPKRLLRPPEARPSSQPRTATQDELQKFRPKLNSLQPWLGEALDAYLGWRWPTWRAQTARHSAQNLVSIFRRLGNWLAEQRQVDNWETFGRADLEAWLRSCSQAGFSPVSVRNYLAQLHMVLRFMEARDHPLDPGLFRVVYLTPPLIDALGRYLGQRPDLPEEDRVFLLRRRSPSPRTIQCRLAKYGQQVGLHVTPHRLRHTLATRLINRDMPIHSLRKLLTKRSISNFGRRCLTWRPLQLKIGQCQR